MNKVGDIVLPHCFGPDNCKPAEKCEMVGSRDGEIDSPRGDV